VPVFGKGNELKVLEAAACAGQVIIVDRLIREDLKDLEPSKYYTALRAAAYKGNVGIVMMLLQRNALQAAADEQEAESSEEPSQRIKSALEAAVHGGHHRIAEVLVSFPILVRLRKP